MLGTDIFSWALDALMIVAITGLWVMWFQQSAQRKKVEEMLLEASDELKEATQLLDHVMQVIADQKQIELEALQQTVAEKSKKDAQVQHADVKTPGVAEQKAEEDIGDNPFQRNQQSGASSSTQIMRLSREGLSENEISEQLGIPAAQVRLILLLQKPKV